MINEPYGGLSHQYFDSASAIESVTISTTALSSQAAKTSTHTDSSIKFLINEVTISFIRNTLC
jgi:hypothetical protein